MSVRCRDHVVGHGPSARLAARDLEHPLRALTTRSGEHVLVASIPDGVLAVLRRRLAEVDRYLWRGPSELLPLGRIARCRVTVCVRARREDQECKQCE